MDALTSFRAQCRLKKAAARVLLNRMTEDDRQSLKAVFSRFDVNGDGQLGPEEVTRLMHSIGKEGEEARLVLSTLDDDGDGGVSLSEFEQAAALGKLNTEAEIKRSFDMFDLDHDGFITHAEIERVCGLNKDTVIGMVREVDKDGHTNSHDSARTTSAHSVYHKPTCRKQEQRNGVPRFDAAERGRTASLTAPCCRASVVPFVSADGRITFDEWLQAMSGRSNLLEQREERMQEKRRSMAQQDKGGKSPSHNRKTISGAHGGGMGRLKEEEEQKEQSSSGEQIQPPAIVLVG